ncbi:MAG: hypothetical protein P1U42_07890 [Phycisphaerales bacterium]|jgi:hypothetical protein|nr:hypothetical protein [Phycisphaerales bacterium]
MTRSTINGRHKRQGNILVGCLVAFGIFLVIAIIATVFVARSWRGWVSGGLTQGLTLALEEAKIDESERLEILAHLDTLMVKFETKEVTLKELGTVVEKIVESPILPAAMVMSADQLYFDQSDLSEEEKAQARIELSRFSTGLVDKSIHPDALTEVLSPISTNTPDDNDIVLNLQVGANGQSTVNALRSADEVSADDLRELVSIAKAKADEVEITQTPEQIDLSNEIAIAIAKALNEDPTSWLPEGVEYVPEPEEDEQDDDGSDDDTNDQDIDP